MNKKYLIMGIGVITMIIITTVILILLLKKGSCVKKCATGDNPCGDDGCNGSCGTCKAGTICKSGQCAPCTSTCGSDGTQHCRLDPCSVGGICPCPQGSKCDRPGGKCIPCDSSCNNALCSSSCSGTCGKCPNGGTCGNDGKCTGGYTPKCEGKPCDSDDGYGGKCPCLAGQTCVDGKCVGCDPSCSSTSACSPTCNGTCGNCTDPNNPVCGSDGKCKCIPSCPIGKCGDDGCHGNCPDCPVGSKCVGQQCVNSSCFDPNTCQPL